LRISCSLIRSKLLHSHPEPFTASASIRSRNTKSIAQSTRLGRTEDRNEKTSFYFLCEIESDALISKYVETLNFWDKRSDEDITTVRQGLEAVWRTWKTEHRLETVVSMVETKLGAYLKALSIDTEFWYEQIRREVNPCCCHDVEFILEAGLGGDPLRFSAQLPFFARCPSSKSWHSIHVFQKGTLVHPCHLLPCIWLLFRYVPLDGTYPPSYQQRQVSLQRGGPGLLDTVASQRSSYSSERQADQHRGSLKTELHYFYDDGLSIHARKGRLCQVATARRRRRCKVDRRYTEPVDGALEWVARGLSQDVSFRRRGVLAR
jgi:hypothetical protein